MEMSNSGIVSAILYWLQVENNNTCYMHHKTKAIGGKCVMVGQKQQLSVEKKKKIEWNSPEAEEHILMCEIKFGVKLFWPLTAQLWPSNNVHGPFTVFLLVNKELLYIFFIATSFAPILS